MVRAMVLVAPAVLNPLDSKFTMDKNPNASLLSPLIELRTRVEVTARLAAFNFQVRTHTAILSTSSSTCQETLYQ